MARKKREYDIEEVDEIIALKLKSVNGILKKLTYNGVYQLNKEVANNADIRRTNGQKFTLFPYDFWGGNYKGEDNYGKKRIDELKQNSQVHLLDKEFDVDVQDILLLINDYHLKPQILSKKLINLFEKDRRKIKRLEEERKSLKSTNDTLNSKLKCMERSIVNIFYSSTSSKNSLDNLLLMKKEDDSIILDELKNIFNPGHERVSVSVLSGDCTESKVIDIGKNSKKKDKISKLGL